ncbi:(S)-ureidoglycine aminohydrolase [Linum perenne]
MAHLLLSWSPIVLFLTFLSIRTMNLAFGAEGFCSAPSVAENGVDPHHLYWKVTNPTLSPDHLQDLPGFTRSVYKADHALITPESHVFSPLPKWTNTLGAYLITPAMGSHFVMYLAKMKGMLTLWLFHIIYIRFIFVVQGSASLTNASGATHDLMVDSYAYFPALSDHDLECVDSATLIVFEKRYVPIAGHLPEQIVGSTDKHPLLETPGEVRSLKDVLLDLSFNHRFLFWMEGLLRHVLLNSWQEFE